MRVLVASNARKSLDALTARPLSWLKTASHFILEINNLRHSRTTNKIDYSTHA
jgi:hypothetical protein